MKNKILIIIPFLLVAGLVSNAYGIEYGKNYNDTILQTFQNGTQVHQWVSHPERIVDYYDTNNKPVYADYRLTQDANIVQLETANSGSLVFDKNTCSYNLYHAGYVGGNNTEKIKGISWTVKGKEASAQNWSNLDAINGASCSVSVQTTKNTVRITGEKSNSNGIFQIVLDYEAGNGFKETMRAFNNNPAWNNHHIGFTETFEVPQVIWFGGQQYDLSNYNQTVLNRNWIENNQAKLVKLTDRLNYDFGIGFNNLNDIKIIWQGGKAKLALNYLFTNSIVPIGQWTEVDPTFGYAEYDTNRVARRFAGVGANCDGASYSVSDPAYDIFIGKFTAGQDCYVLAYKWDITTISDSSTISDVRIRYDIQTVTAGVDKCDYNEINNDPTVAAAQTLYEDIGNIGGGTNFINDDTACASTGNDKILDLGTSADSDVQAQLGVNWWGYGLYYGDVTTWGSANHEINTAEVGFQVELQITYALPPVTFKLRSMHFDNSTSMTSGSVYKVNRTTTTTSLINTTGWAVITDVTHNEKYNYTIKDTNNYVISDFYNYTLTDNKILQNRTLVYPINCDGDGDNDWTVKVNDTAYHRSPVYPTTPTCAASQDITFKDFFAKNGKGPLTNQTTSMLLNSTDTIQYNYSPSRVLVNGSSKSFTFNNTTKVLNVTGIQVGNGYGSFALYFNIRTDNVTNRPTGLSGTPVSTTQINLSWTAPSQIHGSAIQSYQIWRNGTVFLNSTGSAATTYSNTGLSAGLAYLYKICAWNGIGCSPLSTEITAFTHEMTTATIPMNTTMVGDAFGVTPKLRMISGSPSATVTSSQLYRNGTLLDTDTYSTAISKGQTKIFANQYSPLLNKNFLYNHTIRITITNGTGQTQSFSNYTIERPDYTGNYQSSPTGVKYNYTEFRTSNFNKLNLTVNMQNVTFNMQCRVKTQLFETGTWYNYTNIGYFNRLLTVPATQDAYITCHNNPYLFEFTSFGQYNGTLAILDFSEELGDFFGVPIPFLFIIFLAGIFTGVKAPIGAIFLGGTFGFMGVMGFFPDASGNNLVTGAVWSLIVLLGIFGILLGKRYS